MTTIAPPKPHAHRTSRRHKAQSKMSGLDLLAAIPGAVRKLDPRTMWRNPVMLIVEVGAAFTTILAIADPSWFSILITIWLWATVLFANAAEAVAEGRGKAQADSMRRNRQLSTAYRAIGWVAGSDIRAVATEEVAATELAKGDIVIVKAGQAIPADGDVIEGAASIDESAITGESAPVIRESGGDRSAVTGGTRVLSDAIAIRVTQAPGAGFVDRMIALVEGANRQKTPNEIALNILLAALTLVFILVVVSIQPMAIYAKLTQGAAKDTVALTDSGLTGIVLVALLVCLIPTTIGALLSAIGIAGMDRLVQRNVLATSGRAVEAAGNVSTLLLDKTGTITFGDRQARGQRPAAGVEVEDLVACARLASLADETPEGRSIVTYVESQHLGQGDSYDLPRLRDAPGTERGDSRTARSARRCAPVDRCCFRGRVAQREPRRWGRRGGHRFLAIAGDARRGTRRR